MGQIPAFCRTFTGRTHDLPHFPPKSWRIMPGFTGPMTGPKGVPVGIDLLSPSRHYSCQPFGRLRFASIPHRSRPHRPDPHQPRRAHLAQSLIHPARRANPNRAPYGPSRREWTKGRPGIHPRRPRPNAGLRSRRAGPAPDDDFDMTGDPCPPLR